eukprot:EC121487.1.p1 GENE.EC121487.1~~EC121487.1.p1  ORF type:complete len:124 (-),score=6.66 EC121487.1:47-418(-)
MEPDIQNHDVCQLKREQSNLPPETLPRFCTLTALTSFDIENQERLWVCGYGADMNSPVCLSPRALNWECGSEQGVHQSPFATALWSQDRDSLDVFAIQNLVKGLEDIRALDELTTSVHEFNDC